MSRYVLVGDIWKARGKPDVPATTQAPPDTTPPLAGSYPWTTNPAGGYAQLLRDSSLYPDVVATQRFHTFGNLVGVAAADIRSTFNLRTLTQAQVEAEAAADGTVQNFYSTGLKLTGPWAHGVQFENVVIDAPTLYGINAHDWGGGKPSAADRSDWPRFKNIVIRGRAAQAGWNGIDRTGTAIYGGWFVLEDWEAYAAKTIGVKLSGGGVDIRRGHARWLHREGTDHGGGCQIVGGTGGLKTFRDVSIDTSVRWQDGSVVANPETYSAGAAGFQTGSLSSPVDYLLFENCYFDSTPGAGTAFNGSADPASTGGWSSNVAAGLKTEGYVKNNGFYVVKDCRWGRRANNPKSSASETTHINDRYSDGAPL